MTGEEALKVFAIYEQADDYESLMWRVEGPDEIRLLINCSDFFYWATAESEEILAEDVPALRAALLDLLAADSDVGSCYLGELFAARKRKLRPQKPCYKNMEPAIAELFNAVQSEEDRAEADRKDAAWWIAVAHKVKNDNDKNG
jgi:hypothetical protein